MLKKVSLLTFVDNGCKLQLSGPLPKNIANKESLQEIKVEGNFVSVFCAAFVLLSCCQEKSLAGQARPHACLQLQVKKLTDDFAKISLQLTGSIPEEITRMPNLWRLRLQNNRFSGKLPESFRYTSMLSC